MERNGIKKKIPWAIPVEEHKTSLKSPKTTPLTLELQARNTLANCKFCQFRKAIHLQFVHDIPSPTVNRLNTKVQHPGDLLRI